MENILESIRKSLNSKNWYASLTLSLVIPDICGKLEGEQISSRRYVAWFDKYLGKKYQNFLSGNDCYALRCSYLHEGSDNVETQKAKDVLDKFVFISDSSAHRNKFSRCNFGDSKYNGKFFLQLSVRQFCEEIIEATEQWLFDVKSNESVQKNIKEMLKIHERGFSIGGMRIE